MNPTQLFDELYRIKLEYFWKKATVKIFQFCALISQNFSRKSILSGKSILAIHAQTSLHFSL